jgi:hypothetical protein
MPFVRRRRTLALGVGAAVVVAAVLATPGLGHHAEQRFAGQWEFVHGNSPTPGLRGGFALQHRDDESGADILEAIGGIACEEPTDYFAGGYTVPDSEDKPPNAPFDDTGKIRGCTVDDRDHLAGRYESNSSPETVRGDFLLVLDPTDREHWTGTFTIDGDPNTYTWSGFFEVHFDDGAEQPSDPPYPEEPPTEPPGPPGPGEPPPVAEDVCNGKQATITPNPDAPAGLAISGTASADVIVGTDGPDRILGLGGNDTVCGFGGDDEIITLEGSDHVEGGLGSDTIEAGAGDDRLAGDYFDQDLRSTAGGGDAIFAGEGDDYVEAGAGDDLVSGEAGEDRLWGNIYQGPAHSHPESGLVGSDDDQLFGGEGRDTLNAGRGNDKLDGGEGRDALYDGRGSDDVRGGTGDDYFEASRGNDRLDGGEGGETDTRGDYANLSHIEGDPTPKGIRLNLTTGRSSGGAGRDRLLNLELVLGTSKDDVMRGSNGPDRLAGGSGDDDIYGLGGADELIGGPWDDLLIGGPGADLAVGQSGFDQCAAERRNTCERLLPGRG